MNPIVYRIISIAAYVLLAPLVGGLLDGLDRKLSARMQGRVGPPLLQPFYDLGRGKTRNAHLLGRFDPDFEQGITD